MAVEKTFRVEGMDCVSCEYRLGKALRGLEGVIKADANSRTGQVQVTFDESKTPEAMLATRIEQAGFTVAGAQEATSP